MVAGDALDFFLRAEEHRHALVQRLRLDLEDTLGTGGGGTGLLDIIDIGLASYIRRSLPALSGSRASRGYMKMPPRVRMWRTSATIEAIQRML